MDSNLHVPTPKKSFTTESKSQTRAHENFPQATQFDVMIGLNVFLSRGLLQSSENGTNKRNNLAHVVLIIGRL